MDKELYKHQASANGYVIGGKSDREILADIAFHKAACRGMEEELMVCRKDPIRRAALALFQRPWLLRTIAALDGLDVGRSEAEIWAMVCRDRKRKSECHDGGKLNYDKLPD